MSPGHHQANEYNASSRSVFVSGSVAVLPSGRSETERHAYRRTEGVGVGETLITLVSNSPRNQGNLSEANEQVVDFVQEGFHAIATVARALRRDT